MAARKRCRTYAEAIGNYRRASVVGDFRCTTSERFVIRRLVNEGWEVLNKGWPDLLAFRDGKLRFIEIKAGADRLTPEQARIHDLLAEIGVTVEVLGPQYGCSDAE